MDEESLNKLLSALDPDRERAAAKYKTIQQKLITFFRCNQCYSPEDCADTTIDRVAKKISEGMEFHKGDPTAYFFGVARNVLLEFRQQQVKLYLRSEQLTYIDRFSQSQTIDQEEQSSSEQQIQCLEQCLESLPMKSRRLIIEYYQGETSAKIRNRNNLAKKLGISINNLRIQALRIRQRLKECVISCVRQIPET